MLNVRMLSEGILPWDMVATVHVGQYRAQHINI
jgi:hypothetical protein